MTATSSCSLQRPSLHLAGDASKYIFGDRRRISGASAWSAQRREAYANDLGAATSLVAVTARSNRSKSDQDPAQWLPPAAEAHCRYVAEWEAMKLRYALPADQI